ncbi:MAG TPA: DUF1684 domain-containing protein [Thermoplasmata archaeon]|nr:DUF1684 domain-containing protein [Thermoplasmata archaeon]
MQASRLRKDAWLAEAHDSPLPHDIRHGFKGLPYFDYDPDFRVPAVLAPFSSPKMIRMTTSKGVEKDYVEYGRFEFTLSGEKLSLSVFKKVTAAGEHHHQHEREALFVPFRDATSGKVSYGAARYIDVEEIGGTAYDLDFNLAYNPYCAYSPDYVCPFPPRENWLPVAVRAGEKDFAGGNIPG